jgi:ATP-dependent DNA helicase RecG
MNLDTNLIELKGVGERLFSIFEKNDLRTIGDLLLYFPRKYEDYSDVLAISSMRPGLVTIAVTFSNIKTRRVRRGLHITEAIATDQSGKVKVVWFNQPYRSKTIDLSVSYYLSGNFDLSNQQLQITNPSIEKAESALHSQTARILPTYRESKELTSVLIRKIIAQIEQLNLAIPETLPEWVVKTAKVISYKEAIFSIHLPKNSDDLIKAKERLGFEELFIIMCAAQANKIEATKVPSPKIPFLQKSAIDFVSNLPFTLTDAQRKTVWQIYLDMERDEPMNRLVEGDVGSGKTVVAAMASLMVAEGGLQVAVLAPTELLAQQHALTFEKVFSHSKFGKKIGLLTGSLKAGEKKAIKESIENNKISIVIGTHALLQESVNWHNLGLVIIDEQHRFGVQQRQRLHLKSGYMPHVLCLTATPIPRSLALTVYGELSLSILDQAPSNRAGVLTEIVSPNSVKQMYEKMIEQLRIGHQAYIVCPLIEESDSLQVDSAEKVYKELSQGVLKNWKVGLLHGKLKAEEKDVIMRKFISKEIDVLVSTTVIEVGVDVANATFMAILSADRFGLAQLHQLRGRVGRYIHQGYCCLVLSDSKAPSKRMRAIAQTTDGFELAELDLEIRGPGAIYGLRQHGGLDLRIASLTDTKLIIRARNVVAKFMEKEENLLKYKQIADQVRRASKLTYLN